MQHTVDDIKSCNTLRTLNYGNYGIFLIMGNALYIYIYIYMYVCMYIINRRITGSLGGGVP